MPSPKNLLPSLVILSACALASLVGCAAPEEDADESTGAMSTQAGGAAISKLRSQRFKGHCGRGLVIVTTTLSVGQHAAVTWPDGTKEEADLEVSTDNRAVVTSVSDGSGRKACGFTITVTNNDDEEWQGIRVDSKCHPSMTLQQFTSSWGTLVGGGACG
jgi:hypothetical protein